MKRVWLLLTFEFYMGLYYLSVISQEIRKIDNYRMSKLTNLQWVQWNVIRFLNTVHVIV